MQNRIGWWRASGFRRRPIGSAIIRSVPASAASAASRSTGSAGMWTCGVVARTGMPSGIPPAWSPGTCGRRQAIMRPSSSACSNGAARKQAGGYGGPPRSTTASRYSGCGVSTATRHCHHCPLLGRAEPASHQSGCAFGEMRRGSAVPSHSRGRRWADSQSLKPHDCAKMRAAHADYRRRRAGSHRPGVSAMIAERQRPRGGQAAHAPVRKPTAAPRRVTTSE
jgi:hypothetical protein